MEKKGSHIVAETGIHARLATLLVQTASKPDLDTNLEHKGKSISLKSITGIMSLGVGQGSDIIITVDGVDGAEGMAATVETLQKGGSAE